MSEKIDPRKVLVYLNELGYTDITAQQLKEFIKDLKKVMKYDLWQRTLVKTSGESHNYSATDSYQENKKIITDDNKENIPFKTHKDKHIAVHIFDTKPQKCLDHDHCVHIREDETKIKINTNLVTHSSKSNTESITKGESAPSRISQSSSGKGKRPKSAFIRPSVSATINKSDPVALYHFYQSVWKRSKIPGQDSRDDLRWAIREKMLSGPKVEVKSKCNIPRCGWNR